MTATYLDSSVLLRIVLREPDPLPDWRQIERVIVSELVEIECLRTLDRLRLTRTLADDELAQARAAVLRLLSGASVVPLQSAVLRRAAEPFPTPLGTLDALHLATALAWRAASRQELALATHDLALARAGRSYAMGVIGA